MITGIQSILYGVNELDTCARFFGDFGLPLVERTDRRVLFRLEEGSTVELRLRDDPSLPPAFLPGPGPREIVWGVDSESALDRIHKDLSRDRAVLTDADGCLHTVDDAGIAIGLRVYTPRSVIYDAPPENTPSNIRRWNTHRSWFKRAHPRQLLHVVFGSDRAEEGIRFYVERLGFRVTDIMRGRGMFLQCDGRREHHQLFLLKLPRVVFNHVSFSVENIDELAAGANHMQRLQWPTDYGMGRHRLSSLIFYYLANPAGGRAEYSTDGDYLDADWKPRLWDDEFANIYWLAKADDAHPSVEGNAEIVEGPVPLSLAATLRNTTAQPQAGAEHHRPRGDIT